MDALPVQNAIAPAPPVNAAGGTAATDDSAAGDAGAGAPQHFSALLALQLGGAAQTTAKPAGEDAADSDDNTATDTAALVAVDALAGLNLPALLPISPAATVPSPAVRGGAAAKAETAPGERAAAMTATAGRNLLPRAAADAPATTTQGPANIAAARSETAQPLRDAAAQQTAAGTHSSEQTTHAADTPAPAAPPAVLAQIETTAAPAAAAPVQAALEARVGTPDWNTELGQKIVWMIGDRQQSAEMRVNPPELGPLDIKLTIDGAQTTAVFTSPHSAVRDAVESALPRLREVLADSGIMLGNASVTADTPRDSQAFARQPHQGTRSTERLTADTGAPAALPRMVSTTRGLVDLFA